MRKRKEMRRPRYQGNKPVSNMQYSFIKKVTTALQDKI